MSDGDGGERGDRRGIFSDHGYDDRSDESESVEDSEASRAVVVNIVRGEQAKRSEPSEQSRADGGDEPGCGCIIITLIVCITLYEVLRLLLT